jgi:hypothetical protein
MRKAALTVSLARDGGVHVALVGVTKQRKPRFSFRVDELPFKVFGDRAASGQATIAVQTEGSTIAHILMTSADPAKLDRLLKTLAFIRNRPEVRPEDIGL